MQKYFAYFILQKQMETIRQQKGSFSAAFFHRSVAVRE
jgi:hypothetical protein